ncbi:MAG: hypothetical protein U0183_22885 [Polyangiaceae bacterium]
MNISGPTLTLSKLAELESLLRDRSAALSMHLAFLHTGTAVNWATDPEAPIEDLLFAVVGVVVAANEAEEPLRLEKAALVAATHAPDSLYAEIEATLGLGTSSPALYLCPSGWAIAELRAGGADEREPIVSACSEDYDLPPTIELAELPDDLTLFVTYA